MDIDEAVDKLDSRLPLTYRELRGITTALYDTAFDEGARQGRMAGVEHAQSYLTKYARTLADGSPKGYTRATVVDFLFRTADALGDPPVEETGN